MQKVSDVKAYFESESSHGMYESDEAASHSSSAMTSIDFTLGITHGYTRRDLMQLMPHKAEMDRQVATWFNTMDSLRCK